MNVEVWAAASLVAASVLVAEPPQRRVPTVVRPKGRSLPPKAVGRPARPRVDPRRQRVAAIAVGLLIAWVVGGWAGAVAGVASAAALDRLLSRLPSVADQRRRARLHADVPLAGDLLAAAVAAGAPLPTAAHAVGDALGGPLGGELVRAARALQLGATPSNAWDALRQDPVTASLARPLVRAAERGSPPAPALVRAAEELRREAADRAAAAAESAGVRAVGPLGACFLPAFVLLGVVPLVASLAGSLLGGA